MQLTDSRLALQPVCEADFPFMLKLYASVREAELAVTDWTDAQKSDFIAMQFQAQQSAYAAYPNAEYFIIQYVQVSIGRIYIQHQPNAVHIIDLSLIQDMRQRGIGTCVLESVVQHANISKLAVSIHVEKFNPALRLYLRLGFQILEDKGVYLFLQRPCDASLAV